MKNTKDSKTLLDELKTLLDVRKNLIGTDQINNVIADKAEEFVETLYTEIDDEVKKTFEPSATPKSELPCNCHKEEIQEKIINAVVDSVKKNLPPDVNVTVFTVN